MYERIDSRYERFRLKFLLNLDRYVLTAGLALGLFSAIVGMSTLGELSLRETMGPSGLVRSAFQTMLLSITTSVTLVVTISQLVLAQELGPLGDQRERMEGEQSFREDVEELLGTASPPEPNAFLCVLIELSNDKAERLGDIVANSDDELQEDVTQFSDNLVANAELVTEQLRDVQFGNFAIMQAALDYNYSWHIYELRRIRKEYADILTDEQRKTINELYTVLQFFAPAREHIKSLYFEADLVNLSQQILFIGLPALVVAAGMGFFADPGMFPGMTLGIDNVTWVVSGAFTITALPLLLLAAYIFRLTTLAKRTLSIGPSILRPSENTGETVLEE
ncbi:hypothetical protein C480_19959 [Natrialba aegyptia DSM 13077]|uniref:Uncharacterized protein n=2 Tax=Natrialba aegyptia TaxID=129789 RepID=M0AMM8_9EURY|nr:hypothetical protein C480_19959 [Natrialba aegyptia DSM 13077]